MRIEETLNSLLHIRINQQRVKRELNSDQQGWIIYSYIAHTVLQGLSRGFSGSFLAPAHVVDLEVIFNL